MPAAVTNESFQDPSVAPAHGGGRGDGAGQPWARENKSACALGGQRVLGGGSGVRVDMVGGNRRERVNRVARLGSALDEIDTRADGAGGRGGAGTRSGEKVLIIGTRSV